MKLSKLARCCEEYEIFGDAEIKKITSSSKTKGENILFVCNESDENKIVKYLNEAVKNGAVAMLSKKKIDSPIPQIVAKDTRAAYSRVCAELYDNPQNDLKIVGVVGTNGKTTTCRIIAKILNRSGYSCGVIGTLGAFYGETKESLDLTTPDPEDIFRILDDMRKRKIKYVALELSAHAIFYKKLDPVFFEALIFTNCTRDHLDFFKDMANYSNVKSSVFLENKSVYKVINADDAYGKEILKSLDGRGVSYGVDNPAEVFALKIKQRFDGTSFIVNAFDDVESVKIKLLGKFNVYNVLAALSFCTLEGLILKDSVAALKEMEPVEGRLERVASFNGAEIFVDYAHTPDGLEKALLTLSKITENNLVCLFGCGGNRDKEKRPLMGRVAGDIADYVIITSDNPRYEDPDLIIRDIVKGVREATLDYVTVPDRQKAIRCAVDILTRGDVLLIAGKGAEEYQEIMGVRRAYSDKAEVLAAIGED